MLSRIAVALLLGAVVQSPDRDAVSRALPPTTSPGLGPLGLRPIRRSQFYPWVISGALSAAAAALVLARTDTKPRR
jgi:hypothetical protein